jgi:putative Mg2+ transporter-C (MgtC) family protein
MMIDQYYFSSLFSLLLAVLLGGVIGFERAGKNHDAGLRTHILVCLGSATVMVLSRYIHREFGMGDISRLGAQVISGIGFLGMGSIIITGDKIKGLTTAAGLWTTACVGLVVGMGYHLIAVTVVFLMIFVILGLRPIAKWIKYRNKEITVCISFSEELSYDELFKYLDDVGAETVSVKTNQSEADGKTKLIVELDNDAVDKSKITAKLLSIEGIIDFTFL